MYMQLEDHVWTLESSPYKSQVYPTLHHRPPEDIIMYGST